MKFTILDSITAFVFFKIEDPFYFLFRKSKSYLMIRDMPVKFSKSCSVLIYCVGLLNSLGLILMPLCIITLTCFKQELQYHSTT